MHKRLILGMIGLALVLVAGMISITQVSSNDGLLTGAAIITTNTRVGTCSAPDRLRICRDRTSILQIETNDARLSGEAALLYDSMSIKSSYSEHSWGYIRMLKGAGSWVGTWMGSTDADGHTLISAEAQGKGRFTGLVARWRMERSNANGWEPLTVSGSIQHDRPFFNIR